MPPRPVHVQLTYPRTRYVAAGPPVGSNRADADVSMQIRVGYELTYTCPQATPMILALNIHGSRAADIVIPDAVHTAPPTPITGYLDSFGNWCTRLVAPSGPIQIFADALVNDSG